MTSSAAGGTGYRPPPRLRFGLFGTGPWATDVHGPGLAAHPHAELVGVWGRDPAKAGHLADQLGCAAYAEVAALLDAVDAVAVALPPHVQASVAAQAAQAGRHLLLDKPLALTTDVADQIVGEVAAQGLASVVFFTNRFFSPVDAFLRQAAARGGWYCGQATLHASIFRADNPFGASPWRRERGGLWDVGPHVLSLLLPVLGGVDRVAAMSGPYDTTDVLLHHHGGAVSTMSLTLDAPLAATGYEVRLRGEEGVAAVPDGDATALEAFTTAITALSRQVAGDAPGHPCDVRFGRDVVAILEAADTARGTGVVVTLPAAT